VHDDPPLGCALRRGNARFIAGMLSERMAIEKDRLRAIVRSADKRETYRDGGRPNADDVDRILGIAAVMIQADGYEYPEELDAFAVFAEEVRSMTGAGGDATLDEYLCDRDEHGRLDQVRVLAKELSCPAAGALAYKIAIALRDCDQAVEEREYEVEETLATALGLTAEETEALTAEVHEALAES
jgi:hypothetical protein